MARFFLLISFLLTCAAPAFAVDTTDSVQRREFQVHIPDHLAGQKNLPVVIAMHGGGGNAAQFREQTGLDKVADRNGFMVVYPEGTKGLIGNMRTWNAGNCCGPALKRKVDDVAFISAMIDALAEKYAIDRTRVYATGHSNGAMMSYRLACELSDKIAAIAPNGGQSVLDNCRPKRPVAVLHIHGTADPCALYEGGEKCGGCFSEAVGIQLPGDLRSCIPVRESVKRAAAINGCGTVMETVFTKGAVTCEKYRGCSSGADVELCSIKGGGHRWPGSTDIGPPSCREPPSRKMCTRYASIVGPANEDIDAGEFMWQFFKNIKR